MFKARPTAVALAGALFAAGAASAGYQRWRERVDEREHPAPGTLVPVGGRRLHLWRDDDADGPIVVIVPALGTAAVEWRPFQERMSGRARIWLYDRGGLGLERPRAGFRADGRDAGRRARRPPGRRRGR